MLCNVVTDRRSVGPFVDQIEGLVVQYVVPECCAVSHRGRHPMADIGGASVGLDVLHVQVLEPAKDEGFERIQGFVVWREFFLVLLLERPFLVTKLDVL